MLKAFFNEEGIEAGCDEAGRGCLAGPVFAAAVILPKNFFEKGQQGRKKLGRLLNDSKQLTAAERILLRPFVEEHALAWAVGVVTHEEIDEINILNASFLAMHRAIDQLKLRPSRLIIDGNRFNKYTGPDSESISHHCIIEGDGIYGSIAAASILAKTYRDDLMISMHDQYPLYLWNKNKGYATPEHREAIGLHGMTDFHRKTFHLHDDQLELEFD